MPSHGPGSFAVVGWFLGIRRWCFGGVARTRSLNGGPHGPGARRVASPGNEVVHRGPEHAGELCRHVRSNLLPFPGLDERRVPVGNIREIRQFPQGKVGDQSHQRLQAFAESHDYASKHRLPKSSIPPRSIFTQHVATVVSVPKPVQPIQNPPPPGSPWAAVEAARIKLGWSARKLSAEATGEPGSSHYLVLASRNNWDTAGMDTLERFIRACVKGGIPEAELRAPVASVPSPVAPAPVAGREVVIDTLAMAEQAAEQLHFLDKVPIAKAWQLMRGIKLNAPSKDGYYVEARLRLEGRSRPGEVPAPPAAKALDEAEDERIGRRKRSSGAR
jgi:hypothetical protein